MDEEQEKYLNEAVAVVKQESFHMQRALDESNLNEALKHATNMISELKTSLMSPKTYYELYMQVFDSLSILESSFMDEYRRGRNMKELYELVQYNQNILPRLYLLITVGSVYIQTRQAPAKEILKDLIEMTKGVQHPVRGLFLRYYLNKMCKDKLPDLNSEYQGEAGDVTDSLDFLLQNLSEMNRLWIRMQHTGNVRDKTKREKERSDLRVTVGENIVRLSSLEGVTISLYKAVVLPRVLEVVTSSKDVISQQYLMDCIIQAFPDEYHLQSLEPLLEASTQLQPSVEVKTIFINLLNRLSDYAGEKELQIVRDIDIFHLIKNYVDKVVEEGNASDIKKLLQLQVAFLRLSLKVYPLNTENVNMILESSVTIIQKNNTEGRLDPDSLRAIVKLLSFPLETLSLTILSMNYYPKLMGYLQFNSRKQVAFKIVEAVVSSKKTLDNPNLVAQLMEFISPLLSGAEDGADMEAYEFEDEQQNVAKLVHLVQSTDPQVYFELLETLYSEFVKGGPEREKYTYPSLLFGYIRMLLLTGEQADSELLDNMMNRMSELTNSIGEYNPELAIRLKLQCLQAADRAFSSNSQIAQAAFAFGEQALQLYQEELYNSDSKLAAVTLIAGTVATVQCLNQEQLDSLSMRCTRFASRQLKRTDQCNGVGICTHMFWNDGVKDDTRTEMCLKKAAALAEVCAKKNLKLLIGILNKFLYYYSLQMPGAQSSIISQLVELIRGGVNGDSDARDYFENTLDYVRQNKTEGKMTDITFN